MNNIVKKMKSLGKNCAALMLFASIQVNEALAALPTLEEPTRGKGKGIMETIKNHAYDAAILGGLLLSVYGFMKVASALIEGYGEVQAGKKKWGELGMAALVGAIMLVVIIWLLTEAAKIL
ncbi:TIGR03745 family integrating conjugative element membrane protein [Pasteurella oralis]|uniref:TIGR03745 family integrating conjugative element membrane protein n=1 Tax=Pasteurella oralis TaxID=1071947 RepID=UPI000C79ADA3|nr:TIGR03745 family integrating conjugative element membrane protein [Pasteurella oralis]